MNILALNRQQPLAARGPRLVDRTAPAVRTLIARARPSIVGMLVMIAVLLYIQHIFAARVTSELMTMWLAWMWVCVAVFSATVGALLVKRLRAGLPARLFVRVQQIVAAAFCLGIVASVWILMPAADLPLQMLMILLSMWFVAMVVILNPDRLSIYGALAVVASMATFVVVHDLPYAGAVAGFLIGEGVALVALRRFIWRAADDLAAALAITTAERDAKTRFIAAASHDLQQPIQAGWMFAEAALSGSGETARAQAGMRASFTSVQALLETMLDHLRLEAGAVAARCERVALEPLFEEVAAEHRGAATAAGMRLITAGTSLAVLADRSLLKRALGNLVGNAVRHSRGERALIGARHLGGRVIVWVIDDGYGVIAGDQLRLFDDYTQGGDREHAARSGFGIGLASVRRIAELSNGAARFDPRWQGGAAFAIDLPGARQTRP